MYEGSFNRHILPKLGHKRLDQITRTDIAEFIAYLVNREFKSSTNENGEKPDKKKLSRTSISMCMRQLAAVFNHAIEHELIAKNPCKNSAKLY